MKGHGGASGRARQRRLRRARELARERARELAWERARERARQGRVDVLSSNLPMDLIGDIFSRLPLKSIANSRCVSRHWRSVLGSSDFTDVLLTKSLPQLLVACLNESGNEVIFLSSPQDLDQTANHHIIKFGSFDSVDFIAKPVCGLVCFNNYETFDGWKTSNFVWVICNPSTGQSFTLPIPEMAAMAARVFCSWFDMYGPVAFLGYDPILKQHKILALTGSSSSSHLRAVDHQVITLGQGETWRLVECGTPHPYPFYRENICIGGVLYYVAQDFFDDPLLVCFEVGAEMFRFVEGLDLKTAVTLLNYKGKLASVKVQNENYLTRETSTSFVLWVLQDQETSEWSQHVFELPPTWSDVVAEDKIFFVGVTSTGEFVLSPHSSISSTDKPNQAHPHLYYFNPENETIGRVEIQGLGEIEGVCFVRPFLNHVEDLKFMAFP